jgi:MFS family permease
MGRLMDDNEDPRVRPVLRWYLAGYAFSMLGTGLWMPLNAIFLAEERGLPASGVGGYYSVVALCAIAANLFAGSLADRIGPYRPLAVAGLIQGTGITLLLVLHDRPGTYLAAVVCGLGNGTFFAVQTAALTRIFGLANLSTVFGRQYQIANLALGGGSLVLGVLVHRLGYAGYVIGFGLNAASYAVHALNVVGPVRRLAERAGLAATGRLTAKPRPNPLGPYRDRRFVPVILTQLCVSAFGYAQFEAVVPVVFRDASRLPLWMITVYTAANCLAVVAVQPWATRWVKRAGPARGLRTALVVWLASIVPAVAAVLIGPVWLRLLAVVGYAVVFAVGETLVSPSMQPMAASLAPAERLGSYTAAVSLTYSLGMVLGPPLALTVFGALGGYRYWLVIAAGTAAGMLAVRAAAPQRPATPVPLPDSEVVG